MDSLYLETHSLLQQIYPNLASLEKATTEQQAQELEAHISRQFELIISNCERLEVLVGKEPVNRRRDSKYKVDQLKYDCQHLKAALLSVQQKRQMKRRLENDRNDLLSRRFAANDPSTESTAVFMEDAALMHNDRLRRTNRQMDDLIGSGASVLENLRSQHYSLKDIRRKVLDLTSTLGLSNSVMGLIERRSAQDKYFLFGGMLVTLILMYCFYRIIKG